jgi:hypothetical protein
MRNRQRLVGLKLFFLFLFFLFAAFMASCSRSKDHGSPDASAAAGPDAVGIADCDDYLAKYSRCVDDQVPQERRTAFEENTKRTRATWKAMAANPGARPGLGQACRLALDTARTTMQQYHCTW